MTTMITVIAAAINNSTNVNPPSRKASARRDAARERRFRDRSSVICELFEPIRAKMRASIWKRSAHNRGTFDLRRSPAMPLAPLPGLHYPSL